MAIQITIPALGTSAEDWMHMGVADRALLMAAQECDVYHTQELPKGSNSGPRVDAMLRRARCSPGNPWCAAFVTYCLYFAGWNAFSEIPGKGVMYPAAVVSWVAWAKRSGRLRTAPKRGDLFFYDRPGETHIGFVTAVDGDYVETLEGNTDTDGSREGYEVARRKRSIAGITGFIDMSNLPAMPVLPAGA